MDLLQINLKTFLSDIESPFSLHEVCGYLSGFAASNQPVDSYFSALEMYFSNESEPDKKQPDYKIVIETITFVKQSINSGLPIFPFINEDESQDKLIALGEWSKNFVLSINFFEKCKHKYN